MNSQKDYLTKTFSEELNHKLWSTKGSRFKADKRLLIINNLSVKALSFFSAYLIIFGLLSVYQINNESLVNENIVAFGSTACAVLLLVFSQIESTQDYKLRAKEYHSCALKIANIYNDLRIFKTYPSELSDDENIAFIKDLNKRYHDVLEAYPNHENIDFKTFKLDNKEYYELSGWYCAYIHAEYYYKTRFWYHLAIIAPPLLFLVYFFYTYNQKSGV